jgi:multisubunit Na+/H+ antiporter MnhC subunit
MIKKNLLLLKDHRKRKIWLVSSKLLVRLSILQCVVILRENLINRLILLSFMRSSINVLMLDYAVSTC